MSTTMRAKMQVTSVNRTGDIEKLHFSAVGKGRYTGLGEDENNTFARFTPSANLMIMVANPDLHGKFAVGDEFYLDFTPANKPEEATAEEAEAESDEADEGDGPTGDAA